MNPLANALADQQLDAPSRLLYATLYAASDARGVGAMPIAEIQARLGYASTGYLRRLRSQLAAAGYLESATAGGALTWLLLNIDRTPQHAHPAPDKRALTIQSAPVERAQAIPSISSSAPVERVVFQNAPNAPVERAECAPDKRAAAPSAPDKRANRAPVERALSQNAPSALVERAECAPDKRSATPSALHKRANTAESAPVERVGPPHTPPGRQVLINTNTDTNLPAPPTPPTPTDRARSLRLLTAISLNRNAAQEIAGRHHWRAVVGLVARYLADLESKRVRSVGVLPARALDADVALLDIAPEAAELTHPILARFVTDADRAAWRTADAALAAGARLQRYGGP